MCIRAVIYRLGAINGTAEMRALSLQLQALAFRAEKQMSQGLEPEWLAMRLTDRGGRVHQEENGK